MNTVYSIASLITTLSVYLAAKLLYRRIRSPLLSPILICPAVLIAVLLVFHIPYRHYDAGGRYLTDLLSPAIVALAVPLYKNTGILRKYFAEIVVGVAAGSVLSILTSVLAAILLKLGTQTALSIAPRSVTTPIAIEIAKSIGGIPELAAVFVILTGLTGATLGPYLLRVLPALKPVSRGMMFGVGAHGIGTAKAFEIGWEEGAVSSVSMTLAAVASLLLAPPILSFFSLPFPG